MGSPAFSGQKTISCSPQCPGLESWRDSLQKEILILSQQIPPGGSRVAGKDFNHGSLIKRPLNEYFFVNSIGHRGTFTDHGWGLGSCELTLIWEANKECLFLKGFEHNDMIYPGGNKSVLHWNKPQECYRH